MIHPHNPTRPGQPITRAVAHLPTAGPVTIASKRGITRCRNHAAFLEWLTSPSVRRPASHVWLTPRSAGWDLLVTRLTRAGYVVRLTKRRGEYVGIWIARAGRPIGLDEEDEEKGRAWYGQSAIDLVHPEPGLTAEEEARFTWEELNKLDAALSSQWPGLQLGSSVAATSVAAFKRHLERKIGLAPSVAAELRELDVYGGGVIQRFCKAGRVFQDCEGLEPWEVDIRSAYPTAMATVSIPGDYDGMGTESQATDPATITTALVDVPECLYPPLRYRVGKDAFYPYGRLVGTWTAAELLAAEAVGAKIEHVFRVMRFEDRSQEFASFAAAVVAFRQSTTDPTIGRFAKALAVQLPGVLGSKPVTTRITTAPEDVSGCRLDRPGLYVAPTFEPSEREILSAASTITGAVRAWLALFLHGCEKRRIPAFYVHTDGAGTIGDPRPALEHLTALAPRLPSLRIPVGHAITSDDEPTQHAAWKLERLASAECWAPNRRIMIDRKGLERIAAGGISRMLTAEEVRREMRTGEPSIWERPSRLETHDGWTRPFAVDTIDAPASDRLRDALAYA
jgi:hypothetical protein